VAPSRLAVACAAVGTSAAISALPGPHSIERAVFRGANKLPDWLHPPVWAVMQLGALGAAPALGAVAWRAGNKKLATRMVVAATIDWGLAKGVKRIVRRGRPLDLVPRTRIRGKAATGLGYLSGHAAISTSLMIAAAELGAPRSVRVALAGTVGLARMYVGAHLPLDVVGGYGLGVAVDEVVRRYLQA